MKNSTYHRHRLLEEHKLEKLKTKKKHIEIEMISKYQMVNHLRLNRTFFLHMIII